MSSTGRFLVFRHVALVGVFVTSALLFVLLRRLFAGGPLGVLKFAIESSPSPLVYDARHGWINFIRGF